MSLTMPSLLDFVLRLTLDVFLVLASPCSYHQLMLAVSAGNSSSGPSKHTSSASAIHPPYKILAGKDNTDILQANAAQMETMISSSLIDDNGLYITNKIHTNNLEIYWTNSTTDTISISWSVSPDYNCTGYIVESTVEYFPSGGRFTSHPLAYNIRNYTFVNLNAGTMYTLCVHMTEVYGLTNESSAVHSKCLRINTIEFIRRESVVMVLITLGYYVFMGLLGYTQWKRKLYAIRRRRNKNRAAEEDYSRTSTVNCSMRWKELQETENLVNNPGCSIEYKAT